MTQRRALVFSDSAYPDAARAYARGEMDQKSWDNLSKRPLFQVWLRGVLRHRFDTGDARVPATRNQP